MRGRYLVYMVFLLAWGSISGFAREIAIVGATVIDGTGRAPLANATLIIGEDGKIRQVGAGLAAPTGAEVVNAQGKYLIPGFWDMHVHYRWWMAELFLHFGVTTIQDVGNPPEWILAQRDGVAKGKIVGPRIFACGPLIGVPKSMATTTHFQYVEGTEAALRVARELIAKDVDCLKVHGWITPEQAKVVAEQAHRAGKPVVGHATVKNNAVIAVEAGVDQLAHLQGVGVASLKDPSLVVKLTEEANRDTGQASDEKIMNYDREWLYIDAAKTQEVLQFLLKKGTFLEPDLVNKTAPRGGLPRELMEEWFLEESLLYQNPTLRYIPAYFPARALGAMRRVISLTPSQQEEVEKRYHSEENFVRDYVQAGGKVLTGTDTSSQVIPGLSLQRELQLLVRAGLTPLQAIQASSYNCALLYHKENEYGSLQPGRYADLMILDADPLADIRNTRKISAVYKEGKLVDRAFHADFSNPIPEPGDESVGLHGYPMPKLETISPMVATQGDSSVEITLTGTGFIRSSVVFFAGQSVVTQWVSSTELKITVPGELLAGAGTFPVYVTNPFPVLIHDPLHEDEKSNGKYFIVRFK